MIDTLIISTYFILILGYGIYQGRKVKDMKDFSVGNRQFSFFAITATIAATIIGGGTTLSNAAIFYTFGVICFAGEICECIKLFITAKFIIPRMHLFKNSISIGDMMEHLFGKHGKIITGISVLILSTGLIAAQVSGLGFVFNQFLGLDHTTGALIGFSVLTIYSMFGGIRSVIATDMLQFIVLIIAIPLVGSYAVHAAGGYEKIIEQMPSAHFSFFPDFKTIMKFWPYYIAFIIPLTPTVTQRMLISDDTKKLKQSFLIGGFIKLPFAYAIMMIGFAGYILFPDIEPHNVVPSMIDFVLPVGLRGIAITGLLAIIMSTADSYLNLASISFVHDVLRPISSKDNMKNELWLTRIATIAIASGAILIAIYQKSIFEIVQNAERYWLPLVSVPLLLHIIGLRLTQKSFYTSTIITSIFISFYFLVKEAWGIPSHIPSVILSTLIYLICNKCQRRSSQMPSNKAKIAL